MNNSNSNALPTNTAACLSYLFVPAIVFMVMVPYKEDPVVRRHAFHAVTIGAVGFALSLVLGLVTWVLALIPGVNAVAALLSMLLFPAISLAALALTVLLMLKAFQGDMLRLPVVTDLAERLSTR